MLASVCLGCIPRNAYINSESLRDTDYVCIFREYGLPLTVSANIYENGCFAYSDEVCCCLYPSVICLALSS